MSESFDVGRIEAYLTLDRSAFQAGLAAALAEGERFEGTTFTARLNLDTRQADTKLAAFDAAAARPITTTLSADTRKADAAVLLSRKTATRPADMPVDADTAQADREIVLTQADAERPVTMPVDASVVGAETVVQVLRSMATTTAVMPVDASVVAAETVIQVLRARAEQPAPFDVMPRMDGADFARVEAERAALGKPIEVPINLTGALGAALGGATAGGGAHPSWASAVLGNLGWDSGVGRWRQMTGADGGQFATDPQLLAALTGLVNGGGGPEGGVLPPELIAALGAAGSGSGGGLSPGQLAALMAASGSGGGGLPPGALAALLGAAGGGAAGAAAGGAAGGALGAAGGALWLHSAHLFMPEALGLASALVSVAAGITTLGIASAGTLVDIATGFRAVSTAQNSIAAAIPGTTQWATATASLGQAWSAIPAILQPAVSAINNMMSGFGRSPLATEIQRFWGGQAQIIAKLFSGGGNTFAPLILATERAMVTVEKIISSAMGSGGLGRIVGTLSKMVGPATVELVQLAGAVAHIAIGFAQAVQAGQGMEAIVNIFRAISSFVNSSLVQGFITGWVDLDRVVTDVVGSFFKLISMSSAITGGMHSVGVAVGFVASGLVLLKSVSFVMGQMGRDTTAFQASMTGLLKQTAGVAAFVIGVTGLVSAGTHLVGLGDPLTSAWRAVAGAIGVASRAGMSGATTIRGYTADLKGTIPVTGNVTAAMDLLVRSEQSIGSSLVSAATGFKTFQVAAVQSVSQIIQNLQTQNQSLASWAADAQILIRRGMNPAAVASMAQQMPQDLGAMVHASSQQLTNLNAVFAEKLLEAKMSSQNGVNAMFAAMKQGLVSGTPAVRAGAEMLAVTLGKTLGIPFNGTLQSVNAIGKALQTLPASMVATLAGKMGQFSSATLGAATATKRAASATGGWLTTLGSVVMDLAGVAIGLKPTIGAVKSLWAGLGRLGSGFLDVLANLVPFNVGMEAVPLEADAAATAADTAGLSFSAMFGPLGLAVAGLTALVLWLNNSGSAAAAAGKSFAKDFITRVQSATTSVGQQESMLRDEISRLQSVDRSLTSTIMTYGRFGTRLGQTTTVLGKNQAQYTKNQAAIKALTGQLDSMSKSTAASTSAQRAFNAVQTSAASPTQQLTQYQNLLTQQTQVLTTAVNNANSALNTLIGTQLSADQAAIAFQSNLASLTASLKTNGSTMNINTQAGRANRTALDNVSQAILSQITAMTNQHDTIAKINSILVAHEGQLKQVGIQYGLSTSQIQTYLQQMNLTPSEVITTLKQQGYQQGLSQVTNLNNAINQLHNKTITVTVQEIATGTGLRGHFGAAAGTIMKAATGTVIPRAAAASGMVTHSPTYLVGEDGSGHDEYVIPTNPRYRSSAMRLLGGLVGALGMRQPTPLALGGVMRGPIHTGPVVQARGGSVDRQVALGFATGGISPASVTQFASNAGSGFAQQVSSAAAAAAGAGGSAVPSSTVALLGEQMAAARGWTGPQWVALNDVAMRESGWSMTAKNPSSGAYGIAQFISGPSEYAQYGGNAGSPGGQIAAMLNYIAARYGTPTAAWAHEMSAGWYAKGGVLGGAGIPFQVLDSGGYLPPGLSLSYNGLGRPEPVGGAMGGGVNLTVHNHIGGSVAGEITAALRASEQRTMRLLEEVLQ